MGHITRQGQAKDGKDNEEYKLLFLERRGIHMKIRKMLSIMLVLVLMLTFSVSALAQETEAITLIPVEERVIEEISLKEMQQNAEQLRMSCRCGVEMKLIGKTKTGTTACSKFETSTGIKDTIYLYHYECQSCGHASDYQKIVCNH